MITLIIATGNAHKTGEIQAILGSSYHYLTLRDFTAMPAVVEDATTFAGNATKKSVELAQWLRANHEQLLGALTARGVPAKSNSNEFPANCFVLADDSGLEVDYLRGAPGIHSARFANLETGKAGNASDAANREKLLRLLNRVPDSQRRARFRCAIALTPVLADETKIASPVCYADELEFQTGIFEGICEGRIIESSRGSGGFGYDPLFVPEGYDVTFAELGEEAKNRISHRSRALAALQEVLSKLQASCD